MKKPELLAPAGNFESLEAAIHGGCDAVYVGLKHFGARAFANNFTDEEIVSAIKLCHTYGVKLYVTMNTLIHDNEVDDFINKVRFLHKNGVDAILIQDFGMMMLVREMFPNLEVHASTQFNNSSKETLKLLKSIGVKRAVLSRELSLDEVNEMNKVGIETEIFIHGALCVSYSGRCLFSSMNGHRSGNRGECTGCCRLPYKLEQNGKIIDDGYLLSCKELNTSRRIKELITSGVSSLKIEGRMKSSSYVYFITKFYRRLIDNYDTVDIDKEEEKLKVLFNREFTLGHLFNKTDREIINRKSPNHQGKVIGKVIGFTKDKIKIKLNEEIHQEDGIRFKESNKGLIVNFLYNKNDKLVSSCDDICYVDNKIGLKNKDTVSLTSSKYLEKEIMNFEKRGVPVSFDVMAKIGSNLKISVNDGKNKVLLEGKIVSEAINSPTSEERIKIQLEKVGDTPFIVNDIKLDCDQNIFVPIKEINEIRRCALNKLIDERCKVLKVVENKVHFTKLNIAATNYNTILVNSEEELLEQVNNYDRIYITKKDVFNKYKDKYLNIYYSEVENLLTCVSTERNLVYEISYPRSNFDISDYTFNTFNRYSVYYLHKIGYKTVTLSLELNPVDVEVLIDEFNKEFGFYPNIEVVGKARIKLMIIKGDILKSHENVNLIDSKNRVFKVSYNDGYTNIYNYEVRDKVDYYRENFSNINIRIDTTFV